VCSGAVSADLCAQLRPVVRAVLTEQAVLALLRREEAITATPHGVPHATPFHGAVARRCGVGGS
jgi:hypothetical protein